MPLDDRPSLKLALQQNNAEQLKLLSSRAPSEIDPFSLVAQDLDRTKDYAIRNILQTEYKELESASKYNLQLKGKNFRSAILFLLAKALKPTDFDEIYDKVMCLSACIEIAHNASLLQDDIIDKSEQRRSQKAAHKVYGVSTSVFASDWMISRASRMLTEVFSESTDVSQIYSTVLYNLVNGELIQAKRDMEMAKGATKIGEEKLPQIQMFDSDRYFQSYISKTYFKTASMISLGCRGLAVILDLDVEAQRNLFDFGAHLGIAFQVHDDILDFTQSSEKLGKPAFNDLKEGIITAPIIYALLEQQANDLKHNTTDSLDQLKAVSNKFQSEGDIDLGKQMLAQSQGIERADLLSIMHINMAMAALTKVQDKQGRFVLGSDAAQGGIFEEENLQALVKLSVQVKTRKH